MGERGGKEKESIGSRKFKNTDHYSLSLSLQNSFFFQIVFVDQTLFWTKKLKVKIYY